MQVFLDDIAHLGTPPWVYESAEQYHADIQRLGMIVAAANDDDYLCVEGYARRVCYGGIGGDSILAYTTASPNFCWDMAPDSPFYAVECFIEDVSDAAAAIRSEWPAEDDEPEDDEMDGDALSDVATDSSAKPDLTYYVFLDDGDTYSGLDGCTIVGISDTNRRARRALQDEDFQALFDRADLVEPVAAPPRPA